MSGSLARSGVFIFVDENVLILEEVSVNVFECTVRGLGIEEVDNGYKSSIEKRPDDVEFPMQILDA